MPEVKTRDFEYELPPELIAYRPAERREDSRLLVLDRASGKIEHAHFKDVGQYLRQDDLLVLNETRVIKARLEGEKKGTGGKADLLLLKELGPGKWEALVSPSRRLHEGTELILGGKYVCRIAERLSGGKRVVEFETADVTGLLDEVGEVPLPPYIKRAPEAADSERYQTVYAARNGSVAAPTAGLHFTQELLSGLEAKRVETARLTLHVGLGSFRPVKEEDASKHVLEPEYFEIDSACAERLNAARARGTRIVVVGTTSVRALETAAEKTTVAAAAPILPTSGWTTKFIYPPYRFRMVDALITNFHLPRSTLLMLVSAFAGRERIFEAYREAIERKYRFYSYGDAMLIV